jgi:hypothetical protein
MSKRRRSPCFVYKYGMKGIDPKRFGIRILTLGKVEELKRALFV